MKLNKYCNEHKVVNNEGEILDLLREVVEDEDNFIIERATGIKGEDFC